MASVNYGKLVRIGAGDGTKVGDISRIDGSPVERLEKFIAHLFRGFTMSHPCIGAKASFVSGNFYFCVLEDMETVSSALTVCETFSEYLKLTDGSDDFVKTFALVFLDNAADAQDFAQKYWRFLQIVHDIDSLSHEWDPSVSSDANDSNFEFSLNGRAIFTTTLNPGHHRPARRFAYPTWICNQTRQFEKLRELGQFSKWQIAIRQADASLDPSGMANPLLEDHGVASSAKQLAGWPTDPCPLVIRGTTERRKTAFELLLERLKREGSPSDVVVRIRSLYADGISAAT